MGSIPSHAVELLPRAYQIEIWLDVKGRDFHLFLRQHPFRQRDLRLVGSMNDSERTGCCDWKWQHALIVGHDRIPLVFWFWYMSIDMFNCSRVGIKVKCDVCFAALTYFYWRRWTAQLSWSLVMGIHPSWHLSWPQSHWLCCGSHLRPFITALSETPSDRQCSPSVTLNHGASRVDGHRGLSTLDLLCSYICTFFGGRGLSWKSARLLPQR